MTAGDDVIQKVMMTSKIAINIGQCLPELQTISTWYSILDFLENLNLNLKKFQKHLTLNEKSKSHSAFNADVAITLGSITNLFQLSSGFSDEQLIYLLNSVVRIVTDYLEAKHKKKKVEGGISEGDCISQQNLGVIWAANAHRIEVVASETKNILTGYLSHNQLTVKEFGIVRILELLRLLHATSKT